MTEAEKKAKKKYRDKGKRLTVDFYPSEADLIEYIESQPNKQGFIKGLIRAHMEHREQQRKRLSQIGGILTQEEADKIFFSGKERSGENAAD